MNFYSANIALLWNTAMRAAAPDLDVHPTAVQGSESGTRPIPQRERGFGYGSDRNSSAILLQGGSLMFTYICLGTRDLARASRFYDATLGALGLSRCNVSDESDWQGWAGWGTYEQNGATKLALRLCEPFDGSLATAGNGTMVALRATSWREVDTFHAAALLNGGISEGAPGLPQYNPDFYAAYVRDPDGNKLAAICRGFQSQR